MAAAASHLLVLSDRAALAWVLAHQRMAFPAYRAQEAAALQSGDELVLYTTRGCFRNPTRDHGRVMGRASARSSPAALDEPVEVASRTFSYACDLSVTALAPVRTGVELAPLVPRLTSFPTKRGWQMKLRRPVVPLTADDAALLRTKLEPLELPVEQVLAGYTAFS